MPSTALHPRHLLVTTLVTIAALCSAPLVSAKETKEHQAKTKGNKSHKGHKVVRPAQPYDSGSGESRSDRERRLLRECKGRVNAGACAGYTG